MLEFHPDLCPQKSVLEDQLNALLGRRGLNRSPFARPFRAWGFFGKFETDLAIVKF